MDSINWVDVVLLVAGAYALERLMSASNDLRRGNPYRRPDEED